MKAGRNLTDLAAELERQAKAKKDYLADTPRLSFRVEKTTETGNVILDGVNGGMSLRPTAHAQLAAQLGIPKAYYDRLLTQAPDLLAVNANHWLHAQPARRLIRTLDNQVRAVLSDSFRPLDNYDLAQVVLPQLISSAARVESCEITESRFYLKAITDRVQGEVSTGDLLYAGTVVSNSEIGQGKLRVDALDFRLACLNGMISERVIGKAHVGRSNRGADFLEEAREYFRDATRAADDHAFFLKVKDTVTAMFDHSRFNKRLNKYRAAADRIIEASPADVVEVIGKRYSFTEGEQSNILTHLVKGGDLSAWGYANAITRAAQDVESYDRSTELEQIGGDVIELPASAFRVLPAKKTDAAPSLAV